MCCCRRRSGPGSTDEGWCEERRYSENSFCLGASAVGCIVSGLHSDLSPCAPPRMPSQASTTASRMSGHCTKASNQRTAHKSMPSTAG